ncbi:MAG: hypothetical protein EBV03_13575, partial [Proteobacteria bacterium]|nr:hypothetical protein [Pseudomonadota bacterium]
ERARLLKAQADKTELEVKMLSGNLISVEEARHAWAGMVMTYRAKILSIPTRGAQIVAGLTEFHEVENALKGLANEILNEFSDYDPKSSRGIDTRGGEAVCAAAVNDSEPVGGQSPALK